MNNGEKRRLNLPGQHPPLRRAPGSHENSNHTMIFLTNSAPSTTSNLSSSLSMPILESSPDSCYSSCSDVDSHPSLSREPSDNSSLNNAFTNQCNISSTADHMEFATKLGYSHENIKIVLQNLGQNAGQDEILSGLIKLGKSPKQNNLAQRTKSVTQWSTINTPTVILSSDSSNSTKKELQVKLRPIVIDGSNLAMHHGRKEIFSSRGIRECVNFFMDRGHQEIYVFVPQYRQETPRADCPVYDQHILFELEKEGLLIWTPSRTVNGRRIVCHDDRYILKTAAEKDAIIVSNDEYRDMVRENPEYKQMVAQRLLMYSFVDGKFCPPEDPLGKRGPKLDRFLQSGFPFTMQPCPYAKKCTYGNKCKFYHAERLNGIHVSTTGRLLLNKNDHKKQSLSTRPSMIYEQRMDKQQILNSNDPTHDKITRTHSLNFQPNVVRMENQFHQNNFNSIQNHSQLLQPQPLNSFQQQPNSFMSQNTIHQHTLLNRHISAPLNHQLQPPNFPSNQQLAGSRQTSISTTTLTQQQFTEDNSQNFQMFLPSKSVWGDSEFSLSSHGPMNSGQSNEAMTSSNPPQSLFEVRKRIQFNLMQIFPTNSVIAVLNAHPNETNPQLLCQRILAFQSGFNS